MGIAGAWKQRRANRLQKFALLLDSVTERHDAAIAEVGMFERVE